MTIKSDGVNSDPKTIDHVVLEVAASAASLRLMRLVVAAFGTAHGANIDDLEDLRIAVDEIGTHLIALAPDGSRLSVDVALVDLPDSTVAQVGVQVRIISQQAPDSSAHAIDEISALVLAAAADNFGMSLVRGGTRRAWTISGGGIVPWEDGEDPEHPVEGNDSDVADSDAVEQLGWFSRSIGRDSQTAHLGN